MILEVQKINDQYVIKNPPKTSEPHFFIQIEKKHILKTRPAKKKLPTKDKALEQIIALSKKWPKNKFLQDKIKYYMPYTNNSGKTDDDYLYEALKEKYEL